MATSRPYKITAAGAVGRTVVAEDHVESVLEVPPILSDGEMGELIADELRERGFEDGEGGDLSRERGGVKVTVNPGCKHMKVEAGGEITLPDRPPSPCSCRIRQRLQDEQSAHDDLQRQVTKRLEGALGSIGCEVEGAIHRATKKALRKRAEQLGKVKRVEEDKKTGAITIVVEV